MRRMSGRNETVCQKTGLCNITNHKWCDNFLEFYDFTKTNRCKNDDKCVDTVCEEALRCEDYEERDTEGLYCPRYFDGWSCINATKAGEKATFKCPSFNHQQYLDDHKAYRSCNSNGSWYDEAVHKPHTHYYLCPDDTRAKDYWSGWFAESLTKLYVTGYAISLAFLVFAAFTFCYFRSLRCVRNKIHTHLFISLIFNNVSWILWYIFTWYDWKQYFVAAKDWPEEAVVGCRILHFLTHYFMVTTYMWMLCEGLYLFVILTVTFFSEQHIVRILYAIGWALPFVLVVIYTVLRAVMGESYTNLEIPQQKMTVSCWIDDHPTINYIYIGPCIFSVIINILFLCVIVMKLVKMLNSDVSDRNATIKTTKAIAVLIPLFGLHFIISAFVPDGDYTPYGARSIFDTIQAVTTSFQGMVVAILFCFMNSEVIGQLKRVINLSLDGTNRQGQSIAMTQYTAKHQSLLPTPCAGKNVSYAGRTQYTTNGSTHDV